MPQLSKWEKRFVVALAATPILSGLGGIALLVYQLLLK